MTKSHSIRILFASLVAAVCFAPSALAGWHDPVGSPEAANAHYSVASHRTSTHLTKAEAIARLAAQTKVRDAQYRFRRVPAAQR
ncbi:MAG TPA: hypothetical protein VH063_17800 [Gaiellaceae bacterium]|jgi:hypothetical protein|nr:hypothetical protein [Gaiellaceae bacterium]